VHLRCHKSTVVFERPQLASFSRTNDGVSKMFPLFARQFVTQGASIVLLGISAVVEMPGS
jgi:hypothetical protein